MTTLFTKLFGWRTIGKTGNVRGGRSQTFDGIAGKLTGLPLTGIINKTLHYYRSKKDVPWFLHLSTGFVDQFKNGLPREVEFEPLNAWEDLVEATLSPLCRYAFVGRITSNGARELFFYVEKRDVIVDALNRLQDRGLTRSFTFHCEYDEEWDAVSKYFEKL